MQRAGPERTTVQYIKDEIIKQQSGVLKENNTDIIGKLCKGKKLYNYLKCVLR